MQPIDPEVQDFLACSMVARVATVSARGRPHLTPLSFVCDGERIYMITASTVLAPRNVAAHSSVVLLFDAERAPRPDRVLRISGQATLRTDRAARRIMMRRGAPKYYLCASGLLSLLRHIGKLPVWLRAFVRGADSVVVEVVPETAEWLGRPW